MKKLLLFSISILHFAICNPQSVFSQTRIGLDCNQPIDPSSGAIQANATAAVVATTCTPWVRLNFILGPWSSPSDQTLHSGKTWKQTYDQIVNDFMSQGIQVYGLIGSQATVYPVDMMIAYPGTDSTGAATWIQQYVSNFVEIVDYFKDRVRVYESYNEPNNWDNGYTAVVHPKWFAKILQEVYLNTKYFNGHWGDPSWQVTLVSGPILTHDFDTGGSYINDTYWYGKNELAWDWTHQQTGSYPLDGFGMHIYVAQGSSNSTDVINGMNQNLNNFWNNITSYEGATSKQIWISEFGWQSSAVGYQGQADNLTTGFNLLKNDLRIALATWFCLTDWPGASWGLYELGNFTVADQKISFNAYKNQVNCSAIVPTNLLVAQTGCNIFSFSWTNTGNGWWLDVSSDSNFNFYYNKNISNQTSAAAPSGFLCDSLFAPCSPSSLSFQPGITYYWRIWNGAIHSYGQSFIVPSALSLNITHTDASCNGYSDGSAAANTSGGTSPYVYSWSPFGGTLSSYNNLSAGSYLVTVTDSNACTSDASVTITQPNPIPVTITPSGATTFCQGNSVTLTASAANSYLWSNSASTQSITVSTSGNYSVTVTDGNGCSATSSATTVTVNPLPPTPTITANGTILTSSAATGNQWFLNGNIINGATSQTYTVTQNGNYTVVVTDGNGCSVISAPYNFTTVSIQDLKANNSIIIIPNPSNGIFRVETKNLQFSKIKIYNTLGEIIYESKNQNSEIDLSSEPKGIYFVEVHTQDKTYNKKLIIQ